MYSLSCGSSLILREELYAACREYCSGSSIYFKHKARDICIKHNPEGIAEHSKLFALVGDLPEEPEEPADKSDRLTVDVQLEGFGRKASTTFAKCLPPKSRCSRSHSTQRSSP